jgi:hypothetical protein
MKITAIYGYYNSGKYEVVAQKDESFSDSQLKDMAESFRKQLVDLIKNHSSLKAPITVYFNSDSSVDCDRFQNQYYNPNHEKCHICKEQVLTYKDNLEYNVCQGCNETLPDKTGYCSLSCRLGYGCDGSC